MPKLCAEWPDERRAAILFAFEEESETSRFSIHRPARYCLDLAELFGTERVVPVAILLAGKDRCGGASRIIGIRS
jgi:hypothetical protein